MDKAVPRPDVRNNPKKPIRPRETATGIPQHRRIRRRVMDRRPIHSGLINFDSYPLEVGAPAFLLNSLINVSTKSLKHCNAMILAPMARANLAG
jgi:hypothetical protein